MAFTGHAVIATALPVDEIVQRAHGFGSSLAPTSCAGWRAEKVARRDRCLLSGPGTGGSSLPAAPTATTIRGFTMLSTTVGGRCLRRRERGFLTFAGLAGCREMSIEASPPVRVAAGAVP